MDLAMACLASHKIMWSSGSLGWGSRRTRTGKNWEEKQHLWDGGKLEKQENIVQKDKMSHPGGRPIWMTSPWCIKKAILHVNMPYLHEEWHQNPLRARRVVVSSLLSIFRNLQYLWIITFNQSPMKDSNLKFPPLPPSWIKSPIRPGARLINPGIWQNSQWIMGSKNGGQFGELIEFWTCEHIRAEFPLHLSIIGSQRRGKISVE